MVDLVLVSKTQVDWQTLLPAAQLALGRSISASLDAEKLPVEGNAAYACCVSEFEDAGAHPQVALRNDKFSLRHVHYGFLVHGLDSKQLFKLSVLGLSVTESKSLALVSGTVLEWFYGARGGLTQRASNGLKEFFCKVIGLLEKEDFGAVFSSLEKMHTEDGLYWLRAHGS